MPVRAYVPERGDLVFMYFDPQAGHGQGRACPALVISPSSYNKKVGLFIVCPVTNKAKGYPFEVPLPPQCGLTGVVMADQMKGQDWHARKAKFKGRAGEETVEEVVRKYLPLIDPEGAFSDSDA